MRKGNLHIDFVEFLANMSNGELFKGVRHTVPLWAGGAAPAQPKKPFLIDSPTQFLPERPGNRIQINIFDSAMGQMLMAPFGGSFGFPCKDPIGGFIAGASKPVFFHEGLKEMDGMVIGLEPIGGDCPGTEREQF